MLDESVDRQPSAICHAATDHIAVIAKIVSGELFLGKRGNCQHLVAVFHEIDPFAGHRSKSLLRKRGFEHTVMDVPVLVGRVLPGEHRFDQGFTVQWLRILVEPLRHPLHAICRIAIAGDAFNTEMEDIAGIAAISQGLFQACQGMRTKLVVSIDKKEISSCRSFDA